MEKERAVPTCSSRWRQSWLSCGERARGDLDSLLKSDKRGVLLAKGSSVSHSSPWYMDRLLIVSHFDVEQGWRTFSVKSQRVNLSGLVDHAACAATTQLRAEDQMQPRRCMDERAGLWPGRLRLPGRRADFRPPGAGWV